MRRTTIDGWRCWREWDLMGDGGRLWKNNFKWFYENGQKDKHTQVLTDRQKKIAECERDLLELKESTFSANIWKVDSERWDTEEQEKERIEIKIETDEERCVEYHQWPHTSFPPTLILHSSPYQVETTSQPQSIIFIAGLTLMGGSERILKNIFKEFWHTILKKYGICNFKPPIFNHTHLEAQYLPRVSKFIDEYLNFHWNNLLIWEKC